MSWFHGATQRLRAVLQWRRIEADLNEEFRDHLEREVERQLAAGVSPAEARRRAKLRFGEPEVVKESVRDAHGWRLIEDAVTDIRIGLRGLSKNASFTIAALLSLGLGVGGTVAIYSVVHAVLVAPLPYPEPGRLHEVRIWWGDFAASLSEADLLV
ncbi:MAG: permease prefix domain 1-containing protein, partial [Longimicrobiales bacterium]